MIGYKGIQLLSREVENEFEFSTIMWFDKIENVKQFMGEEYENSYVLPPVQKLLLCYDKKLIRCELLHEIQYGNRI